MCSFFFFFNDTATTEIYTLSLHDALPISRRSPAAARSRGIQRRSPSSNPECSSDTRRAAGGRSQPWGRSWRRSSPVGRSEEHTSELQSRLHLVCRLLLEKKKKRVKVRSVL